MKNFVVSAYRQLWKEGAQELFVLNPYIYHVLEKEGRIGDFSNIEVAPFRRLTREDLMRDSEYVDKKYEKYVNILAQRFNLIHGVNHSRTFWKKALSLGFLRYVTLFHDLFATCERHFDASKHTANILSAKSYYMPFDFEDHRYCFQNTDYGQEQIFSLYARFFYPENFEEIDENAPAFDKDVPHCGIREEKLCTLTGMARMIMRNGRLVWRGFSGADRNVDIGIIGAYFEQRHLIRLIGESRARIYPLVWSIPLADGGMSTDWDKRNRLAAFDEDFDRFDKFFFFTLTYCMPKVFVEHYADIERGHRKVLARYRSLQYIICEWWLSDTFMCLLLALAQENGIKHVTPEHNGFFHPFVGSFCLHVIALSDMFLTLGWSDPDIKGLVKGASLYPFAVEGKAPKEHKILYIAAPAIVKRPHYCSVWGLEEESAVSHLEFCKAFWSELRKETVRDIVYRAYPKTHIPLLGYDKEYVLSQYLGNVRAVDDFSKSSKEQMLRARLVVIDYISTSYIEALVMNVPVVFFWDENSYFLNDKYKDFFNVLVDAGICQKDPARAAAFIESIKDDPEKWWSVEKVQAARKEFLERNLGNPEDILDYYLGLLAD